MREMELGGRVTIGGDRRPVIIAGPCVIESEEHCLTMARALRDLAMGAGQAVEHLPFDAANRLAPLRARAPCRGPHVLLGDPSLRPRSPYRRRVDAELLREPAHERRCAHLLPL